MADTAMAQRPGRTATTGLLRRRGRWSWPDLAIAALALLTLLAGAATVYAYLQGAAGYVDNGDGYYLYAARRVAQGARLYGDVLGTQPPLVYLLGALIFKLGGTLTSVRLASAALRMLSITLVYLTGRRLCGDRLTAALAALIFALLPIGLWWDRSFDVNPPLTLVALLAAWPLLRFTPRAACLAGALAALALFTKNLYLPLLLATLLYLGVTRRKLLAPYLAGLAVGLALLALALAGYAGWGGLHDAFLGQEASPFNVAWFVAALAYVAANEGGIVLLAIIGAELCRRQARAVGAARSSALGYAPWWLGGAAAVLLATLKEGTAGPVFQMAEPVVALLAAYAVTWAARHVAGALPRPAKPDDAERCRADTTTLYRRHDAHMRGNHARRSLLAAASLALLVVSSGALRASDVPALGSSSNAVAVARVTALVRRHARPGATIVAPPYYALLAGTRLPGDDADTYIVAQRVQRGDPWAMRWLRAVTADLTARRLPIVLIDLRLAAIAPLMSVLRAHYRPVYGDSLPPALHVVAWLPIRTITPQN